MLPAMGDSVPVRMPWEPEMGAKAISRPRTQLDRPRMLMHVEGSLLDLVRR
jgi:hypothetical protein